jgi:hypothetical protein
MNWYKVIVRDKVLKRCVQSNETPADDEKDAVNRTIKKYPLYRDNEEFEMKATQIGGY